MICSMATAMTCPAPAQPAVDADRRDLLAAAAGDRAAFGAVVERWFARLQRLLQARGHEPSEAEDLAQDALLRAWTALGRYDPRQAAGPWLCTIALRLASNRRRDRRREVALAQAAEPRTAAEPAEAEGSAGPLWCAAREVLPQRWFDALWLYYGEGFDMAGIARVLGISAVHARVLVHRARGRLLEGLPRERVAAMGYDLPAVPATEESP